VNAVRRIASSRDRRDPRPVRRALFGFWSGEPGAVVPSRAARISAGPGATTPAGGGQSLSELINFRAQRQSLSSDRSDLDVGPS